MILDLSLYMLVVCFVLFFYLSYFVLLKKCKYPRLKNKDPWFVTSDMTVKCQDSHRAVEGNQVMT